MEGFNWRKEVESIDGQVKREIKGREGKGREGKGREGKGRKWFP